MVFINNEGKFNNYSYLFDAEFMKLKKTCALYVIEHNGVRMLIDTGEKLAARKLVKKLKDYNLFPIHNILLTHAHWDHIQALGKIQALHKDHKIEVFASQNAVDVLRNPKEMNEFFGYKVDPIESVIALKEGDSINLNGLELKIHNLFGHTMDSIGVENPETKNLFVGDALIDHIDPETYIPVLFGPHFNEPELLKTYKKIQNMKDKFSSISLAHFGVWKDEHYDILVNTMEDKYKKAKELLVESYNQGLSVEQIARKYHNELIPKTSIFALDSLMGLVWNVEQNIDTLKAAGFIE